MSQDRLVFLSFPWRDTPVRRSTLWLLSPSSSKMLRQCTQNPPVSPPQPVRMVELGRSVRSAPQSVSIPLLPASPVRDARLSSTAAQHPLSTVSSPRQQESSDPELDALCAFAGALLPPTSSGTGRSGHCQALLELDGSEQREILDKARADYHSAVGRGTRRKPH